MATKTASQYFFLPMSRKASFECIHIVCMLHVQHTLECNKTTLWEHCSRFCCEILSCLGLIFVTVVAAFLLDIFVFPCASVLFVTFSSLYTLLCNMVSVMSFNVIYFPDDGLPTVLLLYPLLQAHANTPCVYLYRAFFLWPKHCDISVERKQKPNLEVQHKICISVYTQKVATVLMHLLFSILSFLCYTFYSCSSYMTG